MQKMKPEWSKSYMKKPKDNLISHIRINDKVKFKPSFENDPDIMDWVMSWEYGRMWYEERMAFVKERNVKSKPKRIKNDYNVWLQRRRVVQKQTS